MIQKILISGYTGFIGTSLVKELDDRQIYGVDIVQSDSVEKHYSWESLNDCTDTECIIHLAGKAHDIKNITDEQDYFLVNVGLTQKIFQHFLKVNATKFIFFSSIKAVADSVDTDYLTEETIPNPMTSYGKSKLEAERLILTELEKWKENERSEGRNGNWKQIYILRPCMIHGPGNKGNLNQLIKLQKKGLPWMLGAYENKRSFCSIYNIIFVIKQLIDRDIEPGTYQMADDEYFSTNQLIELISDFTGKKARIWRIPPYIIKTIIKIGDILQFPVNSDKLKKLTESYLVSNKRIKNALGINEMPFTALSGMKLTIESFNK